MRNNQFLEEIKKGIKITGKEFKGLKILLLLIFFLLSSMAPFAKLPFSYAYYGGYYGYYQKLPLVGDANKAGVPTPGKDPNDMTCWMATAANMLSGAGYGSGADEIARADDIYQDMLAHYGIYNGGWIEDAIDWWLHSPNNTDPNNHYDKWVVHGTYGALPINDSNLPRTIANELRECNFLGVGIRWPYPGKIVPGRGGHAITVWGDDVYDLNPLTSNPTQMVYTDSDSGVGTAINNYNWTTFNISSGGTTNGWDLNGNPFIFYYVTLEPEPDGVIAMGQKTIHQDDLDMIYNDLHFTAYQKEPWIYILSYEVMIDQNFGNVTVVPWDHGEGDGKIHAITVDYTGMYIPYCTEITITVKFILSEWNTVRFEDVWFTNYGYPAPEKAEPNIGWAAFGIPRTQPFPVNIPWPYPFSPVTGVVALVQGVGANGNGTNNGNGIIYGLGGPAPERGFIIASFDVSDADGSMKSTDKLEHEFDDSVWFDLHTLTLYNDEPTETVYISNLKYGFSEGYLDQNQLKNFNNWLSEIAGPIEIAPNTPSELSVRLYHQPEITEIDPQSGKQGETLNLTITGSKFSSQSTLSFSGGGIVVNSINMVDPTQLTANITILANADTGPMDVYITNPVNRLNVLTNGFEVIAKIIPTPPYYPPTYYPYTPYYPAYNYFNYSPTQTIGFPSGLSTFTQAVNYPAWGYGYYGGFYGSYFYPNYWNWYWPGYYSWYRPFYSYPSWSYSSSDTSSVIGNSPYTENFTFGSHYSNVTINITNY